jgi:4-hydroxy-tetrahydrodipicolinate reductase
MELSVTDQVSIAVSGALGRMGRAVTAVVEDSSRARLAARFDRPGAEGEGLTDQAGALAAAQVVIDFTTPEATVALAEKAAGRGGVALVLGATGLSADQSRRIAEAAGRIAIVQSGNYSLGINMLLGLVRKAAAALPAEDWDIEVLEAHHRRKVDAPSGTALMLGQAAAEGRGVDLDKVAQRGRDGLTGARRFGDIGFAALRGGGVIGEHSVFISSEEETLTLSHSAHDRGLFARGALAAALWVVGKPAGLYDMQDVLGLKDD